ncbi:ABC transporter [Scardovia inopinata]|uniref:Fatty acid ABC transporter ATP-binding/permease protein n=1 Tax=Scardovia inopinata F0304 TaxID=641146 RepID=W5II95_SCAIO|nr:ABC transporter ATP-binding protein [Scardovia inopinata]EFG26597.2 hypothetical protein HMPREF9020_00219 [Scardovia inopinata F0304]SUV51714.1 ABC transporter [Scardovia inopinata]
MSAPQTKELGEKAPGRGRVKVRKGTLSRLLKYVFAYNWQIIMVIVCIIISAAANAAMGLFLQKLIDSYILPLIGKDHPNFMPLVQGLSVMAAIFLVGAFCTLFYNRILVKVEQGVLKTIRDDMFTHQQTLPIKYFDTHLHGDVMSFYTNDTDALRQAISQSLPQMFSSIMSVAAAFVAMLIISVPLTAFVVLFALLLLVVIRQLAVASGKFFVKQQQELGDVNGFIEEAINGQKVIKVFTHEEATQKTFDQKNSTLYDASSQANYFGNITMPVVGNMGYLLYVLVAIVGAGAALSNFHNFSLTGSSALTIGGIVSFLTLSRSFINPIGQISNQFSFVLMALAGASRIFDFLDEKPESNSGEVTLIKAHVAEDGTITQAAHHTDKWAWRVPAGVRVNKDVANVTVAANKSSRIDEARASSIAALAGGSSRKEASAYTLLRGDIRFNDVRFSYEPGHEVLHDISLYAKPGQKVALVGATGAGKTTITNLINRFYDIDSGSILYDGINIKDINKRDLRQSLGIVLQDVNLFTGTVIDNIRYGKLDATDDECISAAKLANADSFIRMLPHGYNTVLQGDGSGLSQGQRQLISIARAAVADPPVMILDEATSSIDTRTEQIVQAGMDALMEGRTVFVIAHRLSTVRNSDVIMVMDHGRIIERGTHDQLLEEKGEYYQLYTGAFELE